MSSEAPPSVARVVVVVIGLATAFGVYRWWNGPERQIRRVLDQLAETVSHETPVTGLQAVTRATRLRELTAPNVVATPGRPFGPIEGRDALMAAAARLISATAGLDVEFVDVNIAVGPARDTATVDLTAKTTVRDRGQETVDAREVMIEFAYLEGRWVMIRAHSIEALERIS